MLTRNSHGDRRQKKSPPEKCSSLLLLPAPTTATRHSSNDNKASMMDNSGGHGGANAHRNIDNNNPYKTLSSEQQHAITEGPDFQNPVAVRSSSPVMAMRGVLREPVAQNLLMYQEEQSRNRVLPSSHQDGQQQMGLGKKTADSLKLNRPLLAWEQQEGGAHWGASGSSSSSAGNVSSHAALVNEIGILRREEQSSASSTQASLFSIEPRSIEEMNNDPILPAMDLFFLFLKNVKNDNRHW
jgi:hypothetical protein